MSTAPVKKTLYHSELGGMGQVTVTITGPVQESKFKRGSFFVPLIVNGTERSYTVENPACGAVFSQYVGHTVTLQASGSREQATVAVTGIVAYPQQAQAAPQPAAPAPQPAYQPPAQFQPPPAAAPPYHPPAPAPAPPQAAPPPAHQPPPPAQRPDGIKGVKASVARCIVAEELIANGVQFYAERHTAIHGEPPSPEALQALMGRIFIKLDRSGLIETLPTQLEEPQQ